MQKQDTEGLQNQWKWHILAAKWQILAPNPCLMSLKNLYFVGAIQFISNFFTTLEF